MEQALRRIEQELWGMSWDQKVALFEMAVSYVGDDFAREYLKGSLSHLHGTISSWQEDGEEVQFFVNNADDHIQKHHLQGRFYEQNELQIISRFFEPGSTYLDVGTNVGNHVVYVCKFLSPAQAIVFEPNPTAVNILQLNVAMNGIDSIVDRRFLGIGLGDQSATASIETSAGNLGATRLLVGGEKAPIRVERGDRLLGHEQIDFIKMDIEGMELAALSGLAAVIERCRPSIFVEVDDRNQPAFETWLATARYVVKETTRRSPSNQNFMLIPAERDAA